MMFKRDNRVTLPVEATLPVPGESPVPPQPLAYAPKQRYYHHPEPADRATVESGLAAFDTLRSDLAIAQKKLEDLTDGLKSANAEIARLTLELAQARNDVASATTITAEAVRAAGDWNGLVRNIKAMIDDFEIAPLPPSAARRKRKNGETPTVPPAPETPADELPKLPETVS